MSDQDVTQRIPLIAETAFVTKIDVVTDQLSVRTIVDERSVVVEDVVERGVLHIERVPVDIPVTVAPASRQEDNTLIVSVIEERLVVEKRLYVVEEVRITRTSTNERVSIPETLRTMRATVEHTPGMSSTGRDSDG